jgi:hypothetical protein
VSTAGNPWDVSFSRTFIPNEILREHENVQGFSRARDILFSFKRIEQGDDLILLGVDEYACSLALVQRALEDFGHLDFVFVGGNWNGYSPQAKEFCIEKKIGLYNSSEISGGLWKTDFWNYAKKDDEGNPIYQFKR